MPSMSWHQIAAVGWPLLGAVLLGLLVHKLIMVVAARARARGEQRLRARVARVVALPLAIALPLFFLAVAVALAPLPVDWRERITHWLGVGGLLCLTWLLVRTVSAVHRRIVREHPLDLADNLEARRVLTRTHVVAGVVQGAIVLVGVGAALMTFPAIRQVGATLLASAGLIGLVAGIAAKPVFGNLIAGLQIALTQPIRLDDVVIVEGEWGRIEEITSAYVVVRIWDERRLVVPLQWFIEHPFQNWTRTTAQLLGTAELWLDHRTPMAAVREALQAICADDPRWDGRVCVAQITDTDRTTVQVRLLVSARNSGELFDLRCAVRERMIDLLNTRYPDALPRLRVDMSRTGLPPEAVPRADALRHAEPTASPGAEDINAADVAARQVREEQKQQ